MSLHDDDDDDDSLQVIAANCPSYGRERKSARTCSARNVVAPPGVMDVRAFGSWTRVFLKKSGGATPEVEKPPRASRRTISPLEALSGFSSLGIPTGKPPRGPLRGSGIFSGSGLVVPFRRCTSVSLGCSGHGHLHPNASFFLFSEVSRGCLGVATPAEPRGEKKLFFCANFGR